MPDVYKELTEIMDKLEHHFRDMQDIEFTVERGKLYILQTRNGKRTPAAAVKIAVDLVKEGLINKQEAVMRVDPADIEKLLHPVFDPEELKEPNILERIASITRCSNRKDCFSAEEAEEMAKKENKLFLLDQKHLLKTLAV